MLRSISMVLSAMMQFTFIAGAEADGTTQIVNEYWQSVEVEVRKGTKDACANNNVFGANLWALQKGGAINVPCSGPRVCWKYRKTDYQNQPWSDWYSEACLLDRLYTHKLN